TVVLAKQPEKFPVQLPATRFKPVAASGLPYTIVVQSLEVDGHDFSGPGEIGIYDGELCVGAVRFTDWPAVVTTWEGSDEHGIPGYVPGHEITFNVWMDELAQTIEAQHHVEMAFGEAPYGLARLTSRPGIIPETFYLEQNYPNPFNPTTHIRYGLPEKTEVNLVIYDITGREVWRHQTGVQSPGKYEVEWRGNDHRGRQVASGIYLYRIQAGSFSAIKKMTLIR
ncbi:MAG: T9SS type A sorting domain-containing protein, partial [Candidatus Marinimicrobia bacterium]|nr:T9SS type A sorting domain-containing protein [Candidatus Neomarinimicrobiota bacterium]